MWDEVEPSKAGESNALDENYRPIFIRRTSRGEVSQRLSKPLQDLLTIGLLVLDNDLFDPVDPEFLTLGAQRVDHSIRRNHNDVSLRELNRLSGADGDLVLESQRRGRGIKMLKTVLSRDIPEYGFMPQAKASKLRISAVKLAIPRPNGTGLRCVLSQILIHLLGKDRQFDTEPYAGPKDRPQLGPLNGGVDPKPCGVKYE